MCGRFSLFSLGDVLARRFGLEDVPVYAPRYNIAPSSRVLVVRRVEDAPAGEEAREAVWMHWGMRSGGTTAKGPLVINARSESLEQRPLFREAFSTRRVMIPADGFFEWRKAPGGKMPYWFSADHAPFALAALWSPRPDADKADKGWDDDRLEGDVVIITTDSNNVVGEIHDRMPVILSRQDEKRWLDPTADPEELTGLVRPLASNRMSKREVSKQVNDATQEGSHLIAPSPQRRLF